MQSTDYTFVKTLSILHFYRVEKKTRHIITSFIMTNGKTKYDLSIIYHREISENYIIVLLTYRIVYTI